MRKYIMLICVMVYIFLSTNCNSTSEISYVYPRMIESSSYLNSNNLKVINNYHPNYVLDDKSETCWVEGVQGDGVGEHLTFFMNIKKGKTLKIGIRNGYQKSQELFMKNNRVRELELKFTYGSPNEVKYYETKYILKDIYGWQEIELVSNEEVWAVTFIIRSVYKGSKYEDTCISDIQFYPDININFEQQHQLKERYNKWFKERESKAKFFSKLPEDYPFKFYNEKVYQRYIELDRWFKWEKEVFPHELLLEEFSDINDWVIYVKNNRDNMFELVNGKTKLEKAGYNIKFKEELFYAPEKLPKNLFKNIGKYLSLDNIMKFNDTNHYKITKNGVLVDRHNKIRVIKELGKSYFYSEYGRLVFIKGKVDSLEWELNNDLIIVWEGKKISRIFWFYIDAANSGVSVRLTIFD